jgi:hypothetical protein
LWQLLARCRLFVNNHDEPEMSNQKPATKTRASAAAA